MESIYPEGPTEGGASLAEVTPAYKRRVWLALLGLVGFILAYLATTAWLVWTTYQLVAGGFERVEGFNRFILLCCYGLLSVFMVKAFFFVKRGGHDGDLEVTAEQEPRLFDFLHRLADEAGAPRPHRVFLSGEVNAAVFYDVSFKNLIAPSKKNLVIGLGLVNVLSLSEIKAVLAHEFGHFAQRSMAIGRWIYVAQQVAAHAIHARDWLDGFLRGLSRMDFRVAWVGWIMRLVIWSIRAIMDSAFGLVVLAQRAMSREMELQADLVAVSLTGSDALIHALHRLQAADQAWDEALELASDELNQGRKVADVFVVQTRIVERIRAVLGDDSFGDVPELPSGERQEHRVFEKELALPPRMWATHPPNRQREDNAKRVYVGAALDDRSAWLLFRDPVAVRAATTDHLFAQVTEPDGGLEAMPLQATLASVDQRFSGVHLDRRYRGAYLGRSIVREGATCDDLYDIAPEPETLRAQFEQLYPEQLAQELEQWRSLEAELHALEAIRDGRLDPPDGIIRRGDKSVPRRRLPSLIDEVKGEVQVARSRVCAHDRRCRTVHRAAAAALGRGWEPFLVGLVEVLHYVEHTAANLADAEGYFGNVWDVITADGNISGAEQRRLLMAATEVHVALWEIFEAGGQLELPLPVLQRLEVNSWTEMLPRQLALPAPEDHNLGEWLNAHGMWVRGTIASLGAVRGEVRAALIEGEAYVAECYLRGVEPDQAPPPARTPASYKAVLPDGGRERQTKLGIWDRFQTAQGLMPSIARFAVAATVLIFLSTVGW
ncbi:MAG: M48 family metallopeptidase [Myxococcales bacterium]|nr:M48 family metallopeptidase [Myxococcales bacterium]